MKIKILLLCLLTAVLSGAEFAIPLEGRTDSYRTRMLFQKFRFAAGTVIPHRTPGLPAPLKLTPSIPPPDGVGTLHAKTVRGTATVFFPPKFRDWAMRPEGRDFTARCFLLAELGIPPEKAESIPDCWLFAAVGRKAAEADWELTPEFGKRPGATALASHGSIPRVMDLLNHPCSPSDGAARLIYEDWCLLLLEFCARAGVLKSGAVETFFLSFVTSSKPDSFHLFKTKVVPGLAAYQEKRTGLKRAYFDLDDWFRKNVERTLFSRFQPLPPQRFEQGYREYSVVEIDGRNRSVIQWAEAYPKLGRKERQSLKLALSERLVRLTELSQCAPPGVFEPFARFVNEVSLMRDNGVLPDMNARLKTFEKEFLNELEFRTALDAYLKDAERRHYRYPLRFGLTLRQNDRTPESAFYRRMMEYLDRVEER